MPYLILDARYEKVRDNGVRSRAVQQRVAHAGQTRRGRRRHLDQLVAAARIRKGSQGVRAHRCIRHSEHSYDLNTSDTLLSISISPTTG